MEPKRPLSHALHAIILLALICSCQPAAPDMQSPANGATAPAVLPVALPAESPYQAVYALVSEESLFAYLEDLVAIQSYSGWRNSASRGEAEALEYVAETLAGFTNLQSQGMTLERQEFEVFLATEIWQADLVLAVAGAETAVAVDGLRGGRFDRFAASYFDSDGALNDSNPQPMTAGGGALIVRDEDLLYTLTAEEYQGRIMFLDYALLDRMTNQMSGDGSSMGAVENTTALMTMIDDGLAGVVLVTAFSNRSGESQGTTAVEGANFAWVAPNRRVPILLARLEDMAPAGIFSWEDLEHIEGARLTLDADVFSPGHSGNLVARIPGSDPSRAVILGAHIDSPANPGALDDGSGCAALLEIARVLDASNTRPVADVYLAWFGSEELGLYGSTYFTATHQDLLDRTLAMVQMDALGLPLEEKNAKITMMTTSYERFGEDSLLLQELLTAAAMAQGISMETFVDPSIASDNNSFDAFGVPGFDLIYVDPRELSYAAHPIHYYSNWHSPYETADRARPVSAVFAEMTRVMLIAALDLGAYPGDLRSTPDPTRRALVISSHAVAYGQMTLRDLGMALVWEGFDVDLIPYGQAVTAEDLEDVSIVILPPCVSPPGAAPEVWSGSESAVLQAYVAGGGLMVVINAANNYTSIIDLNSRNTSARSVNDLLAPMGISFRLGGAGSGDTSLAVTLHALNTDASYLTLAGNNAVAFRMQSGIVLYRAASTRPLVGLVAYGDQGGEVLVVAERRLVSDSDIGGRNMQFIKNLARYASAR